MDETRFIKTVAFGGFDKTDVLNHLEKLNSQVYGLKNEKLRFEGQCLHARKIGFIHPTTEKYMEFTSELPEYFEDYLRKLRNITY